MKERIKGRLLWWSERDGNGIVIDDVSNEYYIDTSVLIDKDQSKNLFRLRECTFRINNLIRDCLCARDVLFSKPTDYRFMIKGAALARKRRESGFKILKNTR